MGIQFDSISPLPSGPAALAAQLNKVERQRRRERGTEQRRQQLVDAAFALFEEMGPQGFNMRHMAQRAGYTPGALYAYFEGKEAVVSALRLRVIERLADGVRSVRPPRSTRIARDPSSQAGPVPSAAQSTPQLQSRSVYVAQSLAWWSRLARERHCLQLLLTMDEAAGPPHGKNRTSDASASALLGTATAPGLATLCAMGLSHEAAQRLHDEVLAYGLGLLVLPSGNDLEARFVQTLHRWLDRECGQCADQAADAGDAGAERQGDLFAA